MLKLTYTETGFNLERLAQPLEDWVKNRAILALRAGVGFSLEPSTAAFLLPADLPQLPELKKLARREGDAIALAVCDADSVEISLQGTWIATDPQSEEGIFGVALSDRTEFFLCKLWQEAQTCASVID